MVPQLTAAELEHVIKPVGRSPRLYAPRTLDANSLAPWRAVQVMGSRCSIDFHSGAFRRRHRCGMDAPVRSYQNAREGRIPIEHAQHLVAAAIRHFEQHTVNTGFPIGREYRLVCRCIEHRD